VGRASPTPQRFAAPETYTPKHLAEKILTSKAALEGERKQVTVLFADLKGSMELLADRDPEEARKILDPVLELMMEAVHRYEGTVNQVMGDGIMALFGAPVAHEDHAVRACYTALRMQEAVKRYAEEARRAHGVAVRIRVGLNSGEVVVRAIGSDLHMDYTAVGQTTHLAARMEQIADPGAIVITPKTLALAEGYVEVKSLGAVPVRGLAEPVEVYEIMGSGPSKTRLQAATRRGLTPFVGRDAELEQLRRAQQLAGAGHGQMVAVVGDPGLGKSRLFWEFIHEDSFQGWLIVESRSISYEKATAFLPLIELLRTYFQIEASDDAHKIREKVARKLISLDRALEPSLPALLWLLEVPVDDPRWQWLDPPQRRQQTLDGIKRLLLRECHVQPLLLVFDDLHWIDAETKAFLDSVVESLPTARLLLLVNYRPEYQHAWGSKTYYRQLSIDPLGPKSAEELLEALLGSDTDLQPLKRLLIARTEGNPFFLEEIVRALVETRAIEGERGGYRLATALSDIQVPPTVQAILAARVDRLSAEDKRLLQSAAVIGKDVPFALLAAIADVPEEELRPGLAHLQAAELLYEVSLFPDVEYTFKHALTHEVTYHSVLKERRRVLHARTMEATERLYGGVLAEHVERLVNHAVRGEVWDKAAVYGAQAGTRAADRSAHAQTSMAFFDTALEAIGHLPESQETLKQGIEWRRFLSSSLFALGEHEAYLQNMDEALALAERLGDEEQLANVLGARTNALWFAGDNPRALESGHRAVTLAEAVGHRIYLVNACLNLGLVCQSVGDHRGALTLFAKAVERLRGDLERERLGRALYPAVMARNELATTHAHLGQFDVAVAIHEEAVRLAEGLGHSTTLLTARLESYETLVRRSAFHDAIPRVEAAIQALRDGGLLVWAITAAALLGYSYVMTGRLREGIPLLREALDQTARGRRTNETRLIADLCEAQLQAGQMGEAHDLADRALGLSRQRVERGTEARLLHLLGAIEAQSLGDGSAAERHYTAAMALALELGLRPMIAHCHLGFGKLYRRTDKREQAQEHLTTATTMYREMGMTYWLEKANADFGA
jgi:class 3 adenylate cyclase/tetratricopeptide (TPR) repeat protein